MFRRSTKLTALLVAAASVASMTPVMAAEKLNQRDAIVYEGIAYDGGKYAYFGYRTDDDDTAIYYNNSSDSKDKEMDDDLEDYEINYNNNKQVKYGTKYAYVTEDGNKDEYLIDLSTGKIVDDETAESKQDSAQSKLISKLKKAERYNKTSDGDNTISSSTVASERLFKNQFGEVWYQYVVDPSANSSDDVKNDYFDDVNGVTTTGASVSTTGAAVFGGDSDEATLFTGFYDDNGKYVDASFLANLKIYNPRKNKATVIEKFGKLYQDEAVKADLLGLKPIAQDKDYIYAVATVKVTYYKYDAVNDKYIFKTDENPSAALKPVETKQYFVQKISKSQGDKEEGAYVPKTVESFQLDPEESVDGYDSVFFDDGNKSDNGKRNDAFEYLLGTVDKEDDTDVLYAVKDGNLFATILKDGGDKVKTIEIKLTTDKVDVSGSDLATILHLGSNDFTNRKEVNDDGEKIDTKIAYRINDPDVDYDVPEYDRDTNGKLGGISIDTEGNTWVINHGKIYKYDDGDFKVQYSTDRSYDRLDVYDKDSLLAWSQDTDSYTTVKEGKAQTVSDAKEIDSTLTSGAANGTTTTAKTGWEQQADGTWVLYDATGNKTTGWANVGGVWYYMDVAGIMKTGWVNDNGTWYYCNASGAMQTGWLQDGSTWYYLQSNGAMKTGWLNDNGTWYYLKSNGAMAANETIDGYYVNASGAWVK